jgi:hypothetical protein
MKYESQQQTERNLTFDMDGVLADFVGGVLIEMQANPGLAHLVVPGVYETLVHKDMELAFPEEYRDEIRAIIYKPDFFLNLPPIEGALPALEHIVESGIKPHICTKAFKRDPGGQLRKGQWLLNNAYSRVGAQGIASVMYTNDKKRHDLGVLVDDLSYYSYYQEKTIPWLPIIFDQPWNRNDPNPLRMTWRNYPEVLAKAGFVLRPLKQYWFTAPEGQNQGTMV